MTFRHTIAGTEFTFRPLTWEEGTEISGPLESMVMGLVSVGGVELSADNKRTVLQSLGPRVLSALFTLWQDSLPVDRSWSVDFPYKPPPPSTMNIQILDLDQEEVYE